MFFQTRFVWLKKVMVLAVLLLFVVSLCDFTVFSDGEIIAELSASESVVHSGAEFTISVELSSAVANDTETEVEVGDRTLSIKIPAGDTKGSVRTKAGKYSKTSVEKYSLKSSSAFTTDGKSNVEIKVLPAPVVSFNASFIMAVAGKKVNVYFKCKNASELTVPLPISLRTNEGKILKEYKVDPFNASFQYALTVENDWVFPYALNVYNELTGTVCASIPVMVNDPDRRGIRRVETTEKKIALGFDCGYNNVYTDYILDTLDEYDAKVTFFVTGFFCKGFPEQLKKIHDRGHEIGNHTMNHLRMNSLPIEEVYKEIQGVNQMVYDKVGVYPVIMRPPYGNANSSVVAVSRMLGCETVFWTMDSYDWDPKKTADFIIKRSTEDMGEGCILLFHNSAPKTKKTLKAILDDYKAKGLKIVPVSELLYDGHYLIDEKGTQKPDPDYQSVKGDELLGAEKYTVTVSGKENNARIALKPLFADDSVYKKKEDVARIRNDPSLLSVKFDFGDSVTAPIGEGENLGKATFTYNNEVWFTADMIAQSGVDEKGKVSTHGNNEDQTVSRSDSTDDTSRQGVPVTIAVNTGILFLAFIVMLFVMNQKKKK